MTAALAVHSTPVDLYHLARLLEANGFRLIEVGDVDVAGERRDPPRLGVVHIVRFSKARADSDWMGASQHLSLRAIGRQRGGFAAPKYQPTLPPRTESGWLRTVGDVRDWFAKVERQVSA